jgi:hypothetical protein
VALLLSTLPHHFLQYRLRSSFHQQPRHLFSKLRALIGRARQALPHMLLTIDRSDARFQHHFATFYPSPRADGHLTTAL